MPVPVIIIPRLTPQQIERFWSKVSICGADECWLWTGYTNSQGYGKTNINRKVFSAHRIAAALAFDSIPDQGYVCHSCDNPSCVNPKHLWFGDCKANIRDMVNKGRGADRRGERCAIAILTAQQVLELREKYNSGKYMIKQLAEEYGLSHSGATSIIRRRCWKHLP